MEPSIVLAVDIQKYRTPNYDFESDIKEIMFLTLTPGCFHKQTICFLTMQIRFLLNHYRMTAFDRKDPGMWDRVDNFQYTIVFVKKGYNPIFILRGKDGDNEFSIQSI